MNENTIHSLGQVVGHPGLNVALWTLMGTKKQMKLLLFCPGTSNIEHMEAKLGDVLEVKRN